jgi:hypothetical protein
MRKGSIETHHRQKTVLMSVTQIDWFSGVIVLMAACSMAF